MAIKYFNERGELISTEYEGRVIKTRFYINNSFCRDKWEVLVWLGNIGEFYEQFKWIPFKLSYLATSTTGNEINFTKVDVDVSLKDGTGDPIMWVNYFAWVSHTEVSLR